MGVLVQSIAALGFSVAFGSLGVPELGELRQMREENARLKRLVADLTLDKQILEEVLRKKP